MPLSAPKPPSAPVIYTANEAKVWQWGWVAGWLTTVPAYLPEPSIVYTDKEAKVWKEGRDPGFWSRHWSGK